MADGGVADDGVTDGGAVVLRLVEGRLAPESWVYAVVAHGSGVLHLGATSLPPAVRTWLHLEHEDPAVARLRGLDPALLRDAVVVAVPVPAGVDRGLVRDLARARVGGDAGGPRSGADGAAGAAGGGSGAGGAVRWPDEVVEVYRRLARALDRV